MTRGTLGGEDGEHLRFGMQAVLGDESGPVRWRKSDKIHIDKGVFVGQQGSNVYDVFGRGF
jgi:hypothetical protein